MLGDKSGFNSVEECFEDLAKHIFAVETGLSSNAPMNWMCSSLDKYTLIANSDAHSPEKLGRNANMFNTEISYPAIIDAMKTGDPAKFIGTIDKFPQEGKYHYAGHRKCNVCWDPVETLKHNEICPVCGKPVVVGVMNRVVELSDREDIEERPNRHQFIQLIPLKEILSEIVGSPVNSKKIASAYNAVLQKAGTEFDVLMNQSIEEIKKSGGEILAEAVRRMRAGEIFIQEGYDGEYGTIKVFKKGEKIISNQNAIFSDVLPNTDQAPKRKLLNFDLKEYHLLVKNKNVQKVEEPLPSYNSKEIFKGLNPEQSLAAEHAIGPALVIAGPGTGKTRVLTQRIANLILEKNAQPENILAVTFTNKAAEEMRERLKVLLKDKKIISKLNVTTFHAFGSLILKENAEKVGREKNYSIIDENDKRQIIQDILENEKGQAKRISSAITDTKQNLLRIDEIQDKNIAEYFRKYENYLREQNAFDFDDLIYQTVLLFSEHPDILENYRKKFQWILIDEYQDVNFSQYKLVRMLMPDKNSNLFVIGDPNQAIYGFRGADVKYIRKFMDDYPSTTIYKLKKSYRCSDLILKASCDVIQTGTSEDSFLKGIQKGVKIKIVPQESDKSEAEFISRTIEQMIGGLRFFSMDSKVADGNSDAEIKSLSDFVVLCRIGRQMDAIEKAFKDHSIPYQKVGEEPFFKKKPIKQIIDLLKAVNNPKNYFLESNLIYEKIIYTNELLKIQGFIKGLSVRDSIRYFIDTYFENIQEEHESSLKRLIELAIDFNNDMEEFLRFVALGTGVDAYKPSIENVTLMTLHAAKGLEFECVFIAGCENGLIPYSLFENQISDIDEERRLLYVGMTRAKKYLYLTHARRRFILGKNYELEQSSFLEKIENELIEISKNEYKKKIKKDDAQLDLF